MDFFGSLWVLDIYNTNWELALSPETIERMGANIREVHVKEGRIWCSNLSWRKLQNLRKLRATCSWERGEMDEFTHMVKLELLDLSGNSRMQRLPRLTGAIGLKTLILNGCVQLEHVGPDGLPTSLESFRLNAVSSQEAKISKICLSGCVHLQNFALRGALPCLEELDLSGTSIRRLDLSEEFLQVPKLERLFLIGCEKLCAILWRVVRRGLKMLRISSQGKDAIRPHGSSFLPSVDRKYDGEVYVKDARFLQSLMLGTRGTMFLITNSLYLSLDRSLESKAEGQSSNHMGIDTCGSEQVVWPVRGPIGCCYHDVLLEEVADAYEAPQLLPLDRHVEIGDGINLTDVEHELGVIAVGELILGAHSLHVHDNSSILSVTPKLDLDSVDGESQFSLKWCHVERCPKLQAVFAFSRSGWYYYFGLMETIWVNDLLTAECIWSKGITYYFEIYIFAQLRNIHLHNCPRLKFVLPILIPFIFPSLETLHIVNCSNLRQIFPWGLKHEAGQEGRPVKKNFPNLRQIYLDKHHRLQQICEAKMFAPKLEAIRVRGSWGLRRLPAVGLRHGVSLPVVDCEKDWWDNLEWDGLEAGHHPSLFKPHHSLYCKKTLPRVSVLH